MHGLYDGLC
uniref:Uncharacterized protein n=1 Tax=Oryza meridionalis TaxID=40149 RepID=A0A0G2KBN8_9ORYZ